MFIIKLIITIEILKIKEVITSISLFTNNEISLMKDYNEDVKNFVNRFKRDYLDKFVPRLVTVTGASTDDLQQMQSLFKHYPYMICQVVKTCGYEKKFSSGNFIFIFLNDLKEESILKNGIILTLCRSCKMIYVFKGIIPNNNDIDSVLTLTFKKYQMNVPFLHLGNNTTKFYAISVTNNCLIKAELIYTWEPGVRLNISDNWESRLTNWNGCRLLVSTLNLSPKMILKLHENGSASIDGGIEGELVFAFAKRMNFSIATSYPSLADRIKYSRKIAILREVATQKSEFSIGRLRPTVGEYGNVSFSTMYDLDCLTWGVPLELQFADIIFVEFAWQVWISIGILFAIICVIGHASHNIDSLIEGKSEKVGFGSNFLNILSIHLGNPVIHIPTSMTGKFLLILSLHYTLVASTAYKSSLASILTTDSGHQTIVDTQGIAKANLSVGGNSYDLNFLRGQILENQTMAGLIDKFIVINDPHEVKRRLRYDKNFALLTRRSALIGEKLEMMLAGEKNTFDILGECILTYPVVMVFPKESLLRGPANSMIRRLTESGILDYWDILGFDVQKILMRTPRGEEYTESSIRYKFNKIFLLYAICYLINLGVFFIEISIWRLKNKN